MIFLRPWQSEPLDTFLILEHNFVPASQEAVPHSVSAARDHI